MAAIYYKQASSRDQNYQISGDDQFIVHNFEEYRAYRDIVFWWKYCQCSDEHVFPRNGPFYEYHHAQLAWQLKSEDQLYRNNKREPAFEVKALHKCLTQRTRYNAKRNLAPEPTLTGLRWRTDASPNEVRPVISP